MKVSTWSGLRECARTIRRRVAEALHCGRYSYNALNNLDRKLERYLDKNKGFFIEAGANDGFQQSNTYYFEIARRWTGVLVEPVPELFEKCRRLRTRSQTVHAALVAPDYALQDIEIAFANLMSVSVGAFGNQDKARSHVAQGIAVQNIEHSYNVRVPARTLTSILDELKIPPTIDLLSLDVEGYEAQALRGLDFSKYRPRYLCIEVRDGAGIDALLSEHYVQVEVLCDMGEYRDVLYRSRLETP